jgi:hypothetical protein
MVRASIIRFTHTTQVKHTLRLDRFVVYAIKKIERDGRLLLPDELKRDYAQTLASFMESTLVECDGQRRFPQYAEDPARALVAGDVSSWDEELCLFSGESALIYYPPQAVAWRMSAGRWGWMPTPQRLLGDRARNRHLVAFRAGAQRPSDAPLVCWAKFQY